MINRLFGSRRAYNDSPPPDMTLGYQIKAGQVTPITIKGVGVTGLALESQIRLRKELRADVTGLALAVAAHPVPNRCVDLRARKVSEMPHKLVNVADKSTVTLHPFLNALIAARKYWSNDLFYLWEHALCVHGECYLEKVVDQFERPYTLRWLNPIVTQPIIINGAIEVFYYMQQSGGDYHQFTPEQVIYDHTHNPTDDFRGLAPMQVALPSVNVLVGVNDYQNGFFQNDATPGGILSADGNTYIGKTDQDRLMQFWKDQLQGARKRFRSIFMPANVKWQYTQQPPSPEHAAVESAATDKVCTAFGIPPSLINSGERRYSAANDNDMKIFYENTVIPECVEMETIVNEQILPWFDDSGSVRFEFDFTAIRALLEDQVKQATAINARMLTGNISLNQARAKFGDLPVEGGDLWFLPKANMPIAESDLKDAASIAQEQQQTPQMQGVAQENQKPVDKIDQQQEAMGELKLWKKLTLQKGLDRGRRFDAYLIPAQVADDLRGLLYGISDLKSADERKRDIQAAFDDGELMLGHINEQSVMNTMLQRIQEA